MDFDTNLPTSGDLPAPVELIDRPALVPVIVGAPELWNWRGLRRTFSRGERFLMVEGVQPAGLLLAQCQQTLPCVLIVDEATLASFDPTEFAHGVDFGRAIQVLVFVTERDERTLLKHIGMGCVGYLMRGAPTATIKRAVQAVAQGEMWYERRLQTRALQQFLFATRSPRLTPRETDILKLIARGLKNRAIAQELSISHETVRWHIRSLHSKLGTEDRSGAAVYAQQYLEDEENSARISRAG